MTTLSVLDRNRIEKAARGLQNEYWKSLEEDTSAQHSPILLLDPKQLIKFAGLRYVECPEIRNDLDHKGIPEAGGLIDRQQGLIAVSSKFSPEYMNFTAAHELGHLVLHTGKILHRDAPMREDTPSLPLEESEANHYAACTLMRREFLVNEFRVRFGDEPLTFDESTGHQLGNDDSEQLLFRPLELERELAIGRARQFGYGNHFDSLCSVFKVSPKTMAIRLKELNLIRYP